MVARRIPFGRPTCAAQDKNFRQKLGVGQGLAPQIDNLLLTALTTVDGRNPAPVDR